PVGARQVNVVGAAGEEVEDARVLEETSDDRAHANVLRQALDPGLERAYAAHQQLDFHARGRCRIQLFDDLRLEQRIHLGDDARRLAGAGLRRLIADRGDDPLVQRERRLPHVLHLAGAAEAGELLEDLRDVGAYLLVRGQQAEVGVQARGARVVIAGRKV